VSESSWNLTPFSVQRFEHELKIRQPGEPVWSVFDYGNIFSDQPLQFILTTKNTSVSGISIEIDDFKNIELDISINKGENLKYDGGNEIVLYDTSWNRIKGIPVNPEKFIVSTGNHKIKVDCTFSAREEASLKLEIKTAGIPEKVGIK
jgi:hypothetical protein